MKLKNVVFKIIILKLTKNQLKFKKKFDYDKKKAISINTGL